MLNHIVGIEEVVFGEQRVANFLRVAIKGAGGAQQFDFLGIRWHRVSSVN
jgi:hypothetical protein